MFDKIDVRSIIIGWHARWKEAKPLKLYQLKFGKNKLMLNQKRSKKKSELLFWSQICQNTATIKLLLSYCFLTAKKSQKHSDKIKEMLLAVQTNRFD